MIIEEASEEGALGSRIWALRGRLESGFAVADEVLFVEVLVVPQLVAGFKSLPVKIELLWPLAGKLGGMGVDSKDIESLLECCEAAGETVMGSTPVEGNIDLSRLDNEF